MNSNTISATANLPGDDPRSPQPPRLRLALGPRYRRAALAGGAPSRSDALKLLRPYPDFDDLRRLPLVGCRPRSPGQLHHPARTASHPENRIGTTFRIAAPLSARLPSSAR